MNMPAAIVTNSPRWNFRQLGAALFIGFVLQSLLLPCLCDIGTAKINFAYCFDTLVLLRMTIAYYGRETDRGWIFYAVLCYTSPAWIEGITYLVLGDT
jgi:hypothetical protein